jgi:hypothetical protein
VALSNVRVLKGTVAASHIWVALPQYGPSRRQLAATVGSSGTRVLAFLIGTEESGWVLEATNSPNGGLLPITQPYEQNADARIRDMVADHTLGSIARQAPLIVSGRLLKSAICNTPKAGAVCYTIAIDTTVVGPPGLHEITVSVLTHPVRPFGKALFFVRPIGGGLYELVGSHDGILPTHDYKGSPLVPGPWHLIDSVRALHDQSN